MANVYQEGDRLVVIHSHELHPPVMPRKYNLSCGCGGTGSKGGGRGEGQGRGVISNLNYISFIPSQVILIKIIGYLPVPFLSHCLQ